MKGVIYLEKIIAGIINNDISLIFMTIIFIAGIICGIYRYIIYEKELKNAECNNKSEKGLTEKILSEFIEECKKGTRVNIYSYVKNKIKKKFFSIDFHLICGYLCLLVSVVTVVLILVYGRDTGGAENMYLDILSSCKYLAAGIIYLLILKIVSMIVDDYGKQNVLTDTIANHIENELNFAIPGLKKESLNVSEEVHENSSLSEEKKITNEQVIYQVLEEFLA